MKIRKRIAAELIRIAKTILAFEMTESQWRKYKKKHPKADPRNHHIMKDPPKKDSRGNMKSRMQRHIERREAVAARLAQLKEKHPNFEPIVNRAQIRKTIKHGCYSVISAGVNPASPEDVATAKHDLTFIQRRTEALRADLDKLGVKYTEVVGCYGGEETSFLITHDLETKADETTPLDERKIMVHDYGSRAEIVKELNRLGAKYNQDSVAHSKNGNMEWHYTTGKRKGTRCIGNGTEFVPASKGNLFTESQVSEDCYTKWAANMDRCIAGTKEFSEANFIENPYGA